MIRRIILILGVLALVSTVSVPAASASSLRQSDETATARYQSAHSETLRAINFYQSARSDYLAARANYVKTKSDADLQTTLAKARDYLLKADQAMAAYLEQLKVKVETTQGMSEADRTASLSELNADISWLKAQESTIRAADTKDDLVAIGTQVRNRWQNIQAAAKRISGRVLVAGANYVITQMEDTEAVIDAKITQAKSEGYDTASVEVLDAQYSAQLDLARNSYKAATVKFNAINNLDNADALLREGKNSITEANSQVRVAHSTLTTLAAEMKVLKKAEVTGSGEIYFQGNGSAVLTGNGTIDGTTGVSTDKTAATLRVVDRAGDANVTTDGKGTVETIDAQTTLYTGLGQATVTGTDMTVTITGPGLDVTASGTGTVSLTGEGTYTTGKGGATKTLDGTLKLQVVGAAVAQ